MCYDRCSNLGGLLFLSKFRDIQFHKTLCSTMWTEINTGDIVTQSLQEKTLNRAKRIEREALD